MKFGIGRISHKSNTFARGLTEFDGFSSHEFARGEEILERYSGTASVIGGAIAGASEQRLDLIPLLSSSTVGGGRVSRQSFEQLRAELTSQVRDHESDLDGVLLELHGAMVLEDDSPGDQAIVQAIRETIGEKPIVVVLDSHANVTASLVSLADIILGYQTYPHTDLEERGHQGVSLLSQLASGDLRPHMSLEPLPLMIPLGAQSTVREPMAEILAMTREAESTRGISSVSVFGGFPFADVTNAGASILVVSESDGSDAEPVVNDLRNAILQRRDQFTVQGVNVEEAVHEAMAAHEGPMVLADVGDNPGAGAPGDGTTLLWALLDLGARNAALASIVDEQAVAACVNAGIDSKVEIPVGGRRDTRHGYPIDVRGKVKSITDGRFIHDGPVHRGMSADAGRTVVLEVEARHDGVIEVILTEKPIQAIDPAFFRHAGIEPTERQFITVKSSVQFRAAFEPIATAIHEVITPGISTPDPAFFTYQRVRRPIFPLDAI